MGGTGWIEELKRGTTFAQVASTIGMTERHRRYAPCPACKRSRSDNDARPTVTVGASGAWKCHSCHAKGDAVALLCYHVTGEESPSTEGWEQVRAFSTSNGWIRDTGRSEFAGSRVRPFGRAASEALQRPTEEKPREPEPQPDRQQNPKGMFVWSDDLPERCASAYANPRPLDPESMRVMKLVVAYLYEYRQLPDDVLLDAKIGIYVDQDGKPILQEGRPFVTIPLPDKAGRIVNIHFRRVPIPGTCEACDALGPWKECDPCRKGKRYRLCPGRPTPLYGADRLTPGKGQVARVMEGEFDVLAMRAYQLGENTVSGTTGAGNFAEDWIDALEPFESVYLCYDNDPSGVKGASELAKKLGLYKCMKVTFPKKDIGDCLIAKVDDSTIHRAFKVAESFLDVKLKKADDYASMLMGLLDRPESVMGVPTGSEVLDTAIGGWANGLVVVTGESGQGKTTFTTWALWKLAHLGHAVAITSFEQQPIMTVLQLLSMELGGDPLKAMREDRESVATAFQRLSELPLYIVDHYGQMPWTKLEEALKYAVRRCGVRYVLIDHLGFLVDPDADDERRAIQAVIRSMVLLRKDMDITMFLIVHPRNDPDASKKFGRVTMQHLKGASAIRQDADLVLVVVREDPNTEKGRLMTRNKRPWPQARIYIDKKRGRFGQVSGAGQVVLAYDPRSQTFADTWDKTPMGQAGLLIDTRPVEDEEQVKESVATDAKKTGGKKGGGSRGSRKGESKEAPF